MVLTPLWLHPSLPNLPELWSHWDIRTSKIPLYPDSLIRHTLLSRVDTISQQLHDRFLWILSQKLIPFANYNSFAFKGSFLTSSGSSHDDRFPFKKFQIHDYFKSRHPLLLQGLWCTDPGVTLLEAFVQNWRSNHVRLQNCFHVFLSRACMSHKQLDGS